METTFEFEKPILEIEKMIEKLRKLSDDNKGDFTEQINELEQKCRDRKREIYENLSPWETVQIARHPKRPILQDYIRLMLTDFIELHGDRLYGDDRAIIGGFATIGKTKVMLIGQNKGRTVEENLERNFAMSNPEGYRKALRLMRLAQKYGLPVVTIIDTPAAFPGKEAEERGQAEAIARNLTEMARLETPIVSVVIGEGGSGGAIGIGVCDTLLMLSNSIYSVIPPEGCAAILWRDSSYAPQAAEALKLTARELKQLGIADEVIQEPIGGAHSNHEETAAAVKRVLLRHLKRLKGTSGSRLLSRRFDKYSKIGVFNR
ncbi:MAG: acetyl-CoA carboxylase carboxyltransferase subunit alpha [Chitinivibrionales bacterium]|nr:acetyl-CoA carboxylase carboxyltransferase subunit alpha [Chitinivibrionales bacterium]